jgi:chromosome segregation ATPase
MWLAAGPSLELIKFAQILAWIILPVLLLSIAITTFLHYRKRKKNKNAIVDPEDIENNFILASPELFNHSIKDGEYVYFDHSGLIREYKNRMFYNHARYVALRKDYAALEAKYLKKSKQDYMKNHNNVQLSPTDNTILAGDYVSDTKELSDKLEQLNRAYQRLEQENRFLQEQVSLQTATDDEKSKILNRWKEECASLMNQVTERDYLEELLEEKKAQISFLQNQLEQRIKNQHQADQNRQQAMAELQQQKEEIDNTQAYFENVLRETKEKNELLNAEMADKRDEIAALKQQVSDERSKLQFVEQRLAANKQLLRRLHKEFSSCIEEENEHPRVVELNQKIS